MESASPLLDLRRESWRSTICVPRSKRAETQRHTGRSGRLGRAMEKGNGRAKEVGRAAHGSPSASTPWRRPAGSGSLRLRKCWRRLVPLGRSEMTPFDSAQEKAGSNPASQHVEGAARQRRTGLGDRGHRGIAQYPNGPILNPQGISGRIKSLPPPRTRRRYRPQATGHLIPGEARGRRQQVAHNEPDE
jgi:hypothetical protein